MQHFVVLALQSVLRLLRICQGQIRQRCTVLRLRVAEYVPDLRSWWAALEFARLEADTRLRRWAVGKRLVRVRVYSRTAEEALRRSCVASHRQVPVSGPVFVSGPGVNGRRAAR